MSIVATMAVGAFGGSFGLVQVGALLLVLVALLSILGRRLGARTTARSVRLTPQHAVHLVELGGRAFVVGTGPGAAPAMLVELPSAPPDDTSANVLAVDAEAEGARSGA